MTNNRRFQIEDLIQSASDMSLPSGKIRKRVLRAAREAKQRQQIRRRVQWSLGASAAAIVLAACFHSLTTPERPSADLTQGPAHGVRSARQDAAKKDWDLVDSFKKDREKQSEVIHGSF